MDALQFTKKGSPRWSGSVKIDDKLTLYYEILEGRPYFNTNVSCFPKISIETGVYYQCESHGESLDEAKGYISDFVELVKKNPQNYYSELE